MRGGPDGAVLLGMLCGGLVALTVLLVVSAAIMRFAVTLANKCLGPSTKSYDDEWEEWEDYDRKSRGRKNNALIPEPSVPRGVGIAFVAYVVNFVASLAIGLVFGVGMRGMGGGGVRGGPDAALFILVQGMSLIASFLIWAGVLTAMLPTSFGRASLVTLFMGLISFVIALVIAVPVFLLVFTARA